MPPEATSPVERAIATRARKHLARQETAPRAEHDLTTMAPDSLHEYVRAAAHAALDAEETHYTDSTGIAPLRQAIAAHLDELGYAVEPEALVVTNGGSEALYLALQAILDGGELAVIEPAPPRAVDMALLGGAGVRRVGTGTEDGFLPKIDTLDLSDSAALLLSSPSTVAGVDIPDDVLRAFLQFALDAGTQPMLDISMTAARYTQRAVQLPGDLVARTVLIGSLSVSHALSGWRIGFLHAPETIRTRVTDLKTSISISTASVAQRAAQAALEGLDGWLAERRARFARRRDQVLQWAEDERFEVVIPDAYPVLLINAAPLGGGDRVARRLAEDGILVRSGAQFGESTRDWIQLNLGADEVSLHAGLQRLAALRSTS